MKKIPFGSRRISSSVLAGGLLAFMMVKPVGYSAIIDWDGTTNSWTTPSNWVGGVAPANSLTEDIARFNQEVYAAQPNAGTNHINGLIFGDGETVTGSLTLSSNNGFAIGSAGVFVHALAGAVTLNNFVRLGADQTWTNNSANTLTVGATVTNLSDSTPVTLTLEGTGNIQFNGAINDNGAGIVGIMVDKAEGIVTFNGSKSFTGGLWVKSGTVGGTSSTSWMGNGTVTLGANGGTGDVTLIASPTTAPLQNNIYISEGHAGTIKLITPVNNNGGINGKITLNNDLVLATQVASSGNALRINGGIDGVGNLYLIHEPGTTVGQIVFGGGVLDFDGEVFSSLSNTVDVQATVTSKVKSFTNNGTGSISFRMGTGGATGGFEVNSDGTTIVNNSNGTISFAVPVTGTGNLYIVNNATVGTGAGVGFFAGSSLNFAGELIYSGDGTGSAGSLMIGAGTSGTVVGPLVKAIIKNSGSGSTVTVRQGIVVNENGTTLVNNGGGTFSVEGGTFGTGDLILQNNSSSADGIHIRSQTASYGYVEHTGRIINSGTGTGNVRISFTIRSSVTEIIQDSATSELFLSPAGTPIAYDGKVSVNTGRLTVTNINMIGGSSLYVAAGGTAAFTAGGTLNLGSLSGAGHLALATGAGFSTTLNVGDKNENTTFSGTITGSQVGFVKSGTGSMTLSGTYGFNNVTVNGGALVVKSEVTPGVSSLGTGNVNVNAGAFGGTGLIRPTGSNKITFSDNTTLVVGDRTSNAFGVLVLDAGATSSPLLTMQGNSKLSFRIGADFESDHIDFWNYTSSFSFNDFVFDGNTVEISLMPGATAGVYSLFRFYEDEGETLAPTFFLNENLQISFLDVEGWEAYFEYNYGSIDLVVVAIPEPSTLSLLGGLFMAAGLGWRRRKAA